MYCADHAGVKRAHDVLHRHTLAAALRTVNARTDQRRFQRAGCAGGVAR